PLIARRPVGERYLLPTEVVPPGRRRALEFSVLRAMPDSQFSGVVGTWEWDAITRQLTWSPELEAFFGLEPGTVRTYLEFRARVHPDDLDRMEARHEAAIRDRQPFDIEFRIVLPSG